MRPSAGSREKRPPPAHALRSCRRRRCRRCRAQTGGAWAPAAPLPVIAINAALLPTGKVLIFAYPGRPGEPGSGFENRAEAYVGHPDDSRLVAAG